MKSPRFIEFLIQGLILLSLATFSIETLPNLNEKAKDILFGIEVFTIAAFTIEYAVRIIIAKQKLGYIFSFYGIIDILSILPFYIGLGVDLRSLRALRLFRLLRLFKLARYSRAMQRFHRAFIISKEEIILFFLSACIMLYLAGVGIYFFENKAQPEVFASVFDGLWWAVATLTTVGYGDCYPITAGGKLFTFLILIIGLGIIAVPTGMVASALAKARAMEEDEQEESSSEGN